MLSFYFLLSAAILIKALTILGFQMSIRHLCNSTLESLLAAWLILQTSLIGCMLLLSCAGALHPIAFWLCLVCLGSISVLAARRSHGEEVQFRIISFIRKISTNPPLAAAMSSATIVLGLLAIRGAYFYDTTDDALYYGLSRIAYWYQNQSMLAFEDTQAVHLFIFDWNSELNALSYFLATGQDRACAFGNIEIWSVFLLSLIHCFRSFRAVACAAWASGFLFGCMPVALYLSMTVKGDLGAGLGCLLGLLWTVHALRSVSSGFQSFWAIVALSYAIGSKISCAPLAGPLIVVHLFLLARQERQAVFLVTTSLFAASLNVCHNGVNFLNYGSPLPFPDMLAGKQAFTFLHFLSAARGLLSALFTRGLEPRQYYAIFGGCGVIGLIVLSVAIANTVGRDRTIIGRKRLLYPRLAAMVVVIFIGSLAFVMSSHPWFPWSFRYYLPWIVPIILLPLLVFCSATNHPTPPARWNIFCFGMLLLGFLHVFAAYRTSEVMPGSSLYHAFQQAASSNDLERKLAGRPKLQTEFKYLLSQSPRQSGSLEILLLSGVSDFIFPLFGDNASNNVFLTDSTANLLQRLKDKKFDLLVITRPELTNAELDAKIAQHGYVALPMKPGMFVQRQNATGGTSY